MHIAYLRKNDVKKFYKKKSSPDCRLRNSLDIKSPTFDINIDAFARLYLKDNIKVERYQVGITPLFFMYATSEALKGRKNRSRQ